MPLHELIYPQECSVKEMGTGLFYVAFFQLALHPIEVGEVVWSPESSPRTVTETELLTWSQEEREQFFVHAYQCAVGVYVDPRLENGQLDPEVYMNHSCNPNTWWENGCLVARRPILPGEQVFYDYASTETDPSFSLACLCGAPNCRGRISGLDYLNPKWQQQYYVNGKWYLPDFMVELIQHSSFETK